MLSLDYIQLPAAAEKTPLNLITIGSNEQPYLNRPVGLPFHQFFLTTKGKGVFRLAGLGDFKQSIGDIMVVPSGYCHDYFPMDTSGWEVAFVGFRGALSHLLLSHFDLEKPRKLSATTYTSFAEEIGHLWSIAKTKEVDAEWSASSKLYALILSIGKLTKAHTVSPHVSINPQVIKIAEYVRKYYAEPLQVGKLANIAGYTPQHFTQIFRAAYGMTLHRFIEATRFEQALFMLKEETHTPVSEIAGRVGMDPNYFIRSFKKKFGVTPGFYQKCHQKK